MMLYHRFTRYYVTANREEYGGFLCIISQACVSLQWSQDKKFSEKKIVLSKIEQTYEAR